MPVAVELDEDNRRELAEEHEIGKQFNQCLRIERDNENHRDEACEQDDCGPTHPTRHELPAGKQFVRHLPGRGTR